MSNFLKISTPANHILQISLNVPAQLNALNVELLQELAHLLDAITQDTTIKGILLTGEGKAFCAGADIKHLAQLTAPEGMAFARMGQAVFRQLELLNKPSLAVLQGFVFGGGCELAMSATLRISEPATLFGQPEIKLGVIPGFGGTQRLARLIGKGRALELCLTGRRFTATEALQWGLINEIVFKEQLIDHAITLMNNIIQYSPIALQAILSTIHQGYDLSLSEAFELEAAHFGICCGTADKQEGVQAFLDKRKAQFRGA